MSDSKNKRISFLAEKELYLEKDYENTSPTTNKATLYGKIYPNGFEYQLFGWHYISDEGRLTISLQAYDKNRKRKGKVEKNKGELVEDSIPENVSIATNGFVQMSGHLFLNGCHNIIMGEMKITKETRIFVKNLRVDRKQKV